MFTMRNCLQLIITENMRICSDSVKLIDISVSLSKSKCFLGKKFFFGIWEKFRLISTSLLSLIQNCFWALILHCFILSSSTLLKSTMLWYQKFISFSDTSCSGTKFYFFLSNTLFLIMTKRGRNGEKNEILILIKGEK